LFGGGRRADGLNPTASNVVDIYEGEDGNHSSVTMSEHRYFHFGGAAKQYVVFGLGARDDPGFANILSWLTAPLLENFDIFDMSPVKKVVRANLSTAVQPLGKSVIMPFTHAGTRINLDVPLDTMSKYDANDRWRLTCEPGFRKSVYDPVPETTVYSSFVCMCTNVTNFFNRPSLFPSDRAVRVCGSAPFGKRLFCRVPSCPFPPCPIHWP
jgi:hypothetical protein